jgi:hypothetical protein
MGKLIIDVSQLFYWKGKLTGIPRVMNEYSQRFANQRDLANRPVFVVWNKRKQSFYSVDISDIAAKHAAQPKNNDVATQAIDSYKTRLILNVKRAEKQSRLIRKTLFLARHTLHIYRNLKSSKSGQYKKVDPTKGDIVIVFWGEWNDSNLIGKLKSFKSKGVKIVQMSYDMIPVLAPQYSGHSTKSLSKYATTVYPLCDAIVSISEHTKKDINTWLKEKNLQIPPIKVVRLGDDFAITKTTKPVSSRFLDSGVKPNEYLLCVGTIEARKNHALLYYTYKLARARGVNLPKLVIVGRLGWQAENVYELIAKDPEINNEIVVLNNVRDSELSWLYSHCLFSLYPSFYEGWGLPIAESIAYGKTCLSSNTSSMPEIAGNLITYFSPYSSDECLSAIVKLLDTKELKRSEQKITRYQSTTWDQSFEEMKAIIESL